MDKVMYYIVEAGGKQYMANKGKILFLPKIDAQVDSIIDLKVITTITENGSSFSESTIKAQVKEHKKDKKVITFKKIRRHGYERTKGHRTELTVVSIL